MARHARYDRKTALDKAVQLFWRRGYYATSMKQIEEALDMRPGSIYAMFGSKDRLFSEALQLYALTNQQVLEQSFETHPTVLQALKSYLERITESLLPDSDTPARASMLVKTLLETSYTHIDLSRQANSLIQAAESTLVAAFRKAKESGELLAETDCERLARLVHAQIIGLRAFAQRDVESAYITDLSDDILDTLKPYLHRA